MSLKIGKKDTREIKVQFDEPGNLLTVTKHDAVVEFKVLSRQEYININDSDDKEGRIDAILDSIVNISGLKNEDGSDCVYSEDVGKALFDVSWIFVPLIQAWHAVQSGSTQSDYYKAKAKN
jgi:hypothetical protein